MSVGERSRVAQDRRDLGRIVKEARALYGLIIIICERARMYVNTCINIESGPFRKLLYTLIYVDELEKYEQMYPVTVNTIKFMSIKRFYTSCNSADKVLDLSASVAARLCVVPPINLVSCYYEFNIFFPLIGNVTKFTD